MKSRTIAFIGRAWVLNLLLGVSLSAAIEIHVDPAPRGDDTNPGSKERPVATPQAAQKQLRRIISKGLAEPVEVIFAAGTYFLDAPLELRPEDSGTGEFPVTWKAAENAEVILSGGRPIIGKWTKGENGIWHTTLPAKWNFRQLFVNGNRATRARFPNVSMPNPFLYATGGGMDHVIIDPKLIRESWGEAADAQINIVPHWKFFNQWNTVTAVNVKTGRIDIADSERHGKIIGGNWFWIEGVREELDEPGEWFLDAETGGLSYMPEPGVDPNSLKIVAPFLNRIVNAKGDVNAGTHVEQVHFERLGFHHTTFTLGHIEARVHTDTAIMFENTCDSSVKNCMFENIGGYTLWLHLDSQKNVFDRNSVRHSGGGGILLTGARLSYMDETKIYTPGEAAAKVAPILNKITRNNVEHCGKIRYYGGGVHLDSRPFDMTMAPGNYIGHNHFNDLSRNGIFAFRNQGGNVIEYNHIHNAMQTTLDGAAIHFATMNTLNSPNYILNNWLYDIWGYEQRPSGKPVRKLANGVFLDWDTSNTTVKDNWIYNTTGGSVKVTFGGNQNVVKANNHTSAKPVKPPFMAEIGPEGTATNGIDLAANRQTGSIISYRNKKHFKSIGKWEEKTAVGLSGLFEFRFLASDAPGAEATFTLPIPEDGNYQISLIYYRGKDRAKEIPVSIRHADGTAQLKWDMSKGSNFGFAVPIGIYRFTTTGENSVTLSTTGNGGLVIADAVAFVKTSDKVSGK